jgi:hypothetical protein
MLGGKMYGRDGEEAGADTVPPLLDLLIAGLLGALLAAAPLLQNPSAYYLDDMQVQYMPTFYSIGNTLRESGTIPFLTTHSWYGGNLIGEFQYALFNPIALALFAVLPSFHTLSGGAAFLAVVFQAILSSGSLLLARNLGISRSLSFVAAVAIATNNFVFYWYASSWFPGLVSMACMVWSMAFLLRASTSAASFLGAGLATACTATAGWPHSLLTLGVFTANLVVLRALQGDSKGAHAPGLAAALGTMAAVVAIVPVFAMSPVATRVSGIYNNGFLTPDLGDILSFVNPLHRGRMLGYQGYKVDVTPFFYAAWFVLPLLCALDWQRVDWRSEPLRVVLAFSVANLALAHGPTQLGPLRYPFRFLPGFQIGVVLTCLVLSAQAGLVHPTIRRTGATAAALCVVAFQSWQTQPDFQSLWVLGALAVACAVVPFVPAGTSRALVLVSASIAVTFLVRVVVPSNASIVDWAFQRTPTGVGSLTTIPRSYELDVSGPGQRHVADRFDDFLFGQMGLALGRATVNGYSPIGHRALAERFCLQLHGWTCPDGGERALRTEPETGAPYLDLMRVERLIVERGPQLRELERVIASPWRRTDSRRFAVVYGRELPNAALPGSLAWPATGVRAEALGVATAEREALRIAQRDRAHRTLTFARTWWPGYRATFNGQSVPVRALDGLLVAVDLPEDASTGELVLSYRPPAFAASVAVSLLALFALMATTLLHARWMSPNSSSP